MKKTVSEEQIERLFQFAREHYVEHYDLQSELVDHLANAIEQRWEETPELPFEDCIKAEFKKFGIFGFMDVVEKRQKALRKKYRKLMWGQVVDFFQLPKILLTGSATFLLYFIVQSELLPRSFFLIASFAFIFFATLRLYKLQNSYKKRIEKTRKKWIMEEYIFNVAMLPSIFVLGIQILIQTSIHKWTVENPYLVFLICLGVVVLLILTYVGVFYLPKNAEKYLAETYPEYKLAS